MNSCVLDSLAAYLPALSVGFQIVPIEMDASFFFLPYQKFTTPRETNTDENIEVRIPRQ